MNTFDAKDWTRRWLAGIAKAAVNQRGKGSVAHLIGAEQAVRQYQGFPSHETATIIHAAIAEVPNTISENVEAVKTAFPL